MTQPLVLSAAALIFNDARRVLLIRENYDRRRYGLPGGALEAGETPSEGVVREVREETGLEVNVGPLVGMYTVKNPADTLVCFAFRCEIAGGEPAVRVPARSRKSIGSILTRQTRAVHEHARTGAEGRAGRPPGRRPRGA